MIRLKYLVNISLAAFILVCGSACVYDNHEKTLVIKNVRMVSRITGEPIQNEKLLNPNNTGADFDVYGTDLGIMWHMYDNRIGMFFGDTSGKGFVINKNGGNGENWRSNVLAFSSDINLEDGLKIDSMLLDSEGKALEVCPGGKSMPHIYQTSIPTSAIRSGNMDCVHIMNIFDWGAPNGRWLTNYSTIYTSIDNAKTWTRRNEVSFSPDSHFSQVAYAKRDGWIFMIGTQSGRGDNIYLARFKEQDILVKQKYEYWNGKSNKWIPSDETAATPVLEGPAGEASLMWHKKSKKWILTYNYDPNYDEKPKTESHAILYTSSTDLVHWDTPMVLADSKDYPALYCAYLHPLKDSDDKLWFIMSMWGPYNTFLMCADLCY